MGTVICFILILAFVLTACEEEEKPVTKPVQQHHTEQAEITKDKQSMRFDHIHGLGYTGDGKHLLLAAHDGLRQYTDGKWSRPPGDLHDYMGFNVVDKGFFSSGHPAPGDDLPNPLGVVFSADKGKNVEVINLLGLTDLHVFGVGYQSHMMLAYNEYPNQVMPKKAYYLSADQGKTWSEAKASGLRGEAFYVAVHPTNPDKMAVLTAEGLFVSDDRAVTFNQTDLQNVTSIFFSADGNQLLFTQLSAPAIGKLKVTDWTRVPSTGELPNISNGTIIYMAQNAKQPSELSLATTRNDVFKSTDGGATWINIARNGIMTIKP